MEKKGLEGSPESEEKGEKRKHEKLETKNNARQREGEKIKGNTSKWKRNENIKT